MQAQQDQLKRVQQQEELQRAANGTASKLEASMSTLASHLIDLRKELDHTIRNMSSHQRDMTEVITELTRELNQARIGAYQPQSCPQEDPLSSMGNKPTRDPTSPQSPKMEHDASRHPICCPLTVLDTNDFELTQPPEEPWDRRFAEVIAEAIVKGLEPLLSSKYTRPRPSVYKGSDDGLVDGWIAMMKHYLATSYGMASPFDQAWRIIEYLETESRDFIFNKSESERDTHEKVFSMLSRRFGTGSNRTQIRQSFALRTQNECESEMQFLDALENLRTQGFPQDSVISRRYEILQRFIEGVRDAELRSKLATMYAHEHYLNEPPTVEALLYATHQYLRTRSPLRELEPFQSENRASPFRHIVHTSSDFAAAFQAFHRQFCTS